MLKRGLICEINRRHSCMHCMFNRHPTLKMVLKDDKLFRKALLVFIDILQYIYNVLDKNLQSMKNKLRKIGSGILLINNLSLL